jgi:hypothetical protein
MEIKLEQLESKVECLEDKLKQVDWYIRSSDDDNFKLAERILRMERKITRFMKTKFLMVDQYIRSSDDANFKLAD